MSPRRAKVLCDKAPESAKFYCWEGIGGILGSLDADTEKRKARCDEATQVRRYRLACYRGAAIT